MDMPSSPTELVAGRYQLIEKAGDGTMSRVYKAVDVRLGNRTVAVKLLNTLRDDELQKEIFRRETKALDQLEGLSRELCK
jgi:serine/threonine protein kinase